MPRNSRSLNLSVVTRTLVLVPMLAFLGDGPANAANITSIGPVHKFTDGLTMGVSGDGSTVVYRSATNQAYQWTPSGGSSFVGDLPGGGSSGLANAASHDGSVIVGSADSGDPNQQAYRYTTSGISGLGYLGAPTNLSSTAYGVSADGTQVIGSSTLSTGGSAGFLWNPSNGLQHLSGMRLGYDISADGSVMVGSNNSNEAVRLTGFGTMSEQYLALGILPGRANSIATAVSADGSTIVGTSQGEGFWWTLAPGIQSLGSGGATDSVSDVSGDGSLVVGKSGSSAFIWDQVNGHRDLETVLTSDYGLDLTDWTLVDATGISDDGKIIVGVGIGPGTATREGWIVDLNVAAVPLPAAVWLFGSGLVGLIAVARRRRSVAQVMIGV